MGRHHQSWVAFAVVLALVFVAVPAMGDPEYLILKSQNPSPAPSQYYGNLTENKVYSYNNQTGQLVYVGLCGSECEPSQTRGTDGQCLYAGDWKSPPENPALVQAQYLSYGTCASVSVSHQPAAIDWHLTARTQCKQLTGESGSVAYRTTFSWKWLDIHGNVMRSDARSVLFSDTNLVCPNFAYLDAHFNQAGAKKFCGRTEYFKNGVVYRDTGDFCIN